jgi:hypothetical protein
MPIELNHQELNILLFALEGAPAAAAVTPGAEPSCEESCPVVDHFDELFGGLTAEKKLANHLNNHLREGMLECGFLDVMETIRKGIAQEISGEDQLKLQQVNERLQGWRCEINLDDDERRRLRAAGAHGPRNAWGPLPRTHSR